MAPLLLHPVWRPGQRRRLAALGATALPACVAAPRLATGGGRPRPRRCSIGPSSGHRRGCPQRCLLPVLHVFSCATGNPSCLHGWRLPAQRCRRRSRGGTVRCGPRRRVVPQVLPWCRLRRLSLSHPLSRPGSELVWSERGRRPARSASRAAAFSFPFLCSSSHLGCFSQFESVGARRCHLELQLCFVSLFACFGLRRWIGFCIRLLGSYLYEAAVKYLLFHKSFCSLRRLCIHAALCL